MRVINKKNENLWEEVDRSLAEHSASGYKIACIEAEKVFKSALKQKNYPTKDLNQIIGLFGWKLTDKEGLKKALTKTREIKETFDYSLTSFEAEDIVESFKQGINDFTAKKALSWQKKLMLFWQNYISLKTSFAKKVLLSFLGFFFLVKLLSSTGIGQRIVWLVVSLADLTFSWLMFLIVGIAGLAILALIVFMALEKKNTRIKSIK